jgi:hypothetical protein
MSKNVYQLIAAVAAEIATEGISKNRKNQQQGYNFRGIDDVYNALAPVIAKHGLVILPRCLSREVTERANKSGGVIFSVTVEAEFDFVSSHDGSKHTVKTYGEAMDSADKATNKAMSAAYKYAAFQTFCIPTEGDNDADATSHDVRPKEKPATLTEEEVANIQALAEEVGSEIKPILTYYKTDKLESIPRLEYQKIIRSLEKKRQPAPEAA